MIRFLLTLALLLITAPAFAQQLAFPSAEGFGRFATGGRGGAVIHVTNTNNSGAGSLRECLLASGARTCVFDVGGIITLQSVIEVVQPNVTIAGQTAPGDGIMIRGNGTLGNHLLLNASNIIIRYLRIRPGYSTNEHSAKAWGVYARSGVTANNIIIDHGSFGWASDDIASIGGVGDTRDITVQWSIFSEGIFASSADPGKPFLMAVNSPANINTRISFHHNLLAHFNKRNPRISSSQIDFVNNVIYHWTTNENILPTHAPLSVNMIKNHYSRHTVSTKPIQLDGGKESTGAFTYTSQSSVYIEGNIDDQFRTDDQSPQTDSYTQDSSFPITVNGSRFNYPLVNTTSAVQARTDVLSQSGATKPTQDDIDERTIGQVAAGTGGFITHQNDVGGYPTYSGSRAGGYDTDGDGMPNTWEELCSGTLGTLDPDVSDGNTALAGIDAAVNGYTARGVFWNELAGDYEEDTCGEQLTGDTTAPTVSITVPSGGATLAGNSETITATASDDSGTVTNVKFYANNVLIGSDNLTPFSITWDTTQTHDGDKALTAEAHDAATNVGTSAVVNAVVDNIPAYTAIHTATPPTIDGNLTEFAGANNVQISEVGNNTTDFKFMWDDTNLYIGAHTTDAQLVAVVTAHDQNESPFIFNDDAIEILIDTDNDGVYDATDYKFIVNAAETTWDASGPTSTLSYEPTYSAQVVLVSDLNDGADDTLWTIEIAIPWSELNSITPAPDQTYGINVQIDDMDASRTAYRWNGAINDIRDAMDVVLGQDEPPDTEDPTEVAITAPANGGFIGGTYPITATANDNAEIDRVEFFEGANLLCTDSDGAPYTCSWDTTLETEGSYSLTVEACDTATTPNCTTSSPATSVTVDNTAPSTPTNLTLSAGYDEGDFTIFANWDNSTDASGDPTYSVESCEGAGCDTFVEVGTEPLSDFFDGLQGENTTYCYRVRALDAAQNPSDAYSDTECVRTLEAIGIFVADGAIDSVSGLDSLPFIGGGVIDSISGLSAVSVLDDGVIDSVSGLSSLEFISDGTIDSVSID